MRKTRSKDGVLEKLNNALRKRGAYAPYNPNRIAYSGKNKAMRISICCKREEAEDGA